MIIIKNTPKERIIKVIDTVELVTISGIRGNLSLLKTAEQPVLDKIEDYINTNAVFKGIRDRANREISKNHTLLELIEMAATSAEFMLEFIQDEVKKSKVTIYDDSSLTFKQKGMMDWINTINFFGRYTVTMMDVLLEQPNSINSYLHKVNFDFINRTASYYSLVLKRLNDSTKNLKASITMLSDEAYDSESESILRELKGKSAVTVGLTPHELNPWYWVRFAEMKLDVRLIQRNREEIDTAAMKIQKLENELANNPDPSIQRRIEKWQDRIVVLSADIAETEAKYE